MASAGTLPIVALHSFPTNQRPKCRADYRIRGQQHGDHNTGDPFSLLFFHVYFQASSSSDMLYTT